jgi:hypothetical protein
MRRLLLVIIFGCFCTGVSAEERTGAASTEKQSGDGQTAVPQTRSHTFGGSSGTRPAPYSTKPITDESEPLPKPVKYPIHVPPASDMVVHPFKFPRSMYDQPQKKHEFVPDNSQLYVHSNIRQTVIFGRYPGVTSTPYLPEFVGRKTH